MGGSQLELITYFTLLYLVLLPCCSASTRGHGLFALGIPQREDVCWAPIAAPDPRSEAEARLREDIDDVLSDFWDGKSGYGISTAEELEIASVSRAPVEPGRRPSTYGEVTVTGARQIARALGLDALHGDPIVFMDLGSGVGKFVAQAFLEWPLVKRAVGIELSHSRSQRAQAAWDAVVSDGTAAKLRSRALKMKTVDSMGKVDLDEGGALFIESDLFAADVKDATHIYVASLCFSDDMLERLASKLAEEAVNVQAVGTLRRFPQGVKGLTQNASVHPQMSWTHGVGSQMYVYKRSGS